MNDQEQVICRAIGEAMTESQNLMHQREQLWAQFTYGLIKRERYMRSVQALDDRILNVYRELAALHDQAAMLGLAYDQYMKQALRSFVPVE